MKKYIKSVIALTLVCGVMAVILAVTNYFTSAKIKETEQEAAKKALIDVMPEGDSFEEVDISAYSLPESIQKVHKESSGGYVLEVVTKGYGSGMVIMCGIDSDGVVTGSVCLKSSETLGYEKTYGEKMIGKNADTLDSVDTIASATLTTTGYKAAIADAFDAVEILNKEA
jgi:Na+-translocating ferredoxin:NAD+ oxidoreductase RnfG subunit